jgi:hypothetical protein
MKLINPRTNFGVGVKGKHLIISAGDKQVRLPKGATYNARTGKVEWELPNGNKTSLVLLRQNRTSTKLEMIREQQPYEFKKRKLEEISKFMTENP